MELAIDNRKKEINLLYNLNLNYWDAIFWQNNKLQINNEKQIAEIINKEAKSQLSYLLTLTKQPEFFIIDYHDNIFLKKFALFQVELLRMRGDDIKANFLENNLEQ